MGKKLGEFKYNVGDIIKDDKRYLRIIDRYYVSKTKIKKGKEYTANEKWYKYRCLKCGNIDSLREYSIDGQKHGCNACCNPPKKVIKGVNDISTTAKWMMDYIIDDDYCYSNIKYSKEKTSVKCPNCGRISITSAYNIFTNHSVPCSCKDGHSYPNKYMYSFLEQSGVNFESEKSFSWSNRKRYDFYIQHNESKIICEMQGMQHYNERNGWNGKTLDDEIKNDKYKKSLALSNEINYYYQIDASSSDAEYIKDSIINSGLLKIIDVCADDINWDLCGMFASSNIYKIISEYHEQNPYLKCEDIACYFKVSKDTVFKAIKFGLKYGWCSISFMDTKHMMEENNLFNHGAKPIYCLTNDSYYRDIKTVCDYLTSKTGLYHSQGTLWQYIRANKKYKENEYTYITREEFNEAKSKFPDKCHGNFFNIKENVA